MKSTRLRVLVAMLLGLGVVVISAPASYAVTTCLGLPATWEGTAGDDTAIGTNGNDVFVGLGGNDTVDGLGGDDLFCLGDGNDVATGGDGTNHFVDGPGADSYYGGPAHTDVLDYSQTTGFGVTIRFGIGKVDYSNDTFQDIENAIGTPYDDVMFGDSAANVLTGLAGGDMLDGGAGDDQVVGGSGTDWIVSGPGDDLYVAGSTLGEPSSGDRLTFEYSTEPVAVSLAAGTATGEGSDTISDFATVIGSPYDDELTGDDLPNVLQGGKGDDVLDGAGGDDQLDGEDGYNIATFASSPNGVTANIFEATGDGTDTLHAVSEVIGSSHDDTLIGPSYGLYGVAGNDTFIGSAWFEHVEGGPGDDTFLAGDGGEILAGPGNDTVTFEHFTQGVHVDLTTGTASATDTTTAFLDTPEVLIGSPYDDVLTGSTGTDTINGLGGADTLRGLGGDDHLAGGEGDDTLLPGEGGLDAVMGGGGTDTVSYEHFGQGVSVDLSTGHGTSAGTTITFVDVPEVLTGSPYDDDLTGSIGADTVNGLGGADTLRGLAGNDALMGGSGGDSILGGADNDEIHGGAGGDILDDSTGDDIVTGDQGSDLIYSGPGDDTLLGGSSISESIGEDWLDLRYSATPVHLSLTDHTAAGEGSDIVAGFARVVGTDYADVLTGDDGPNLLQGGKGDDVLDGAGGDDQLDGEDGYNIATFASSPNGVTASILGATGDGTDTLNGIWEVEGSPYDDTFIAPSHGMHGMAGNDTFIGTDWSDNFDGGPGDDTFRPGEGGDDEILAGDGIDTVSYEQFGQGVSVDLSTGQGTAAGTTTTFVDVPEVLIGSPYDDVLTGSNGPDVINGLGGADAVLPGEGDDQVTTGDGIDTISYADILQGVQANLTTGLSVGAGTDTFLDVPEVLSGTPYDDVLIGSAGADTINGLGGADTFRGLGGDDHLAGGEGIDTVDFAAAAAAITANLMTGTASGEGQDTLSGVENLGGSAYADILTGNAQANVLTGRAGNDRMKGLDGADRFAGGPGVDLVSFGAASRRVTADLTDGTAFGEGSDTLLSIESLIGSRFSDTLMGSAIANFLKGGPGADLLDGRAGHDSLFGNGGPDLLVGGTGTDFCSGGPDPDHSSGCESTSSIP